MPSPVEVSVTSLIIFNYQNRNSSSINSNKILSFLLKYMSQNKVTCPRSALNGVGLVFFSGFSFTMVLQPDPISQMKDLRKTLLVAVWLLRPSSADPLFLDITMTPELNSCRWLFILFLLTRHCFLPFSATWQPILPCPHPYNQLPLHSPAPCLSLRCHSRDLSASLFIQWCSSFIEQVLQKHGFLFSFPSSCPFLGCATTGSLSAWQYPYILVGYVCTRNKQLIKS